MRVPVPMRRQSFLLTIILLSAFSWLATSEVLLFLGVQKAIWMSVHLQGPLGQSPRLDVLPDGASSPLRTLWADGGTHVFVGLQPLSPGLGFLITEVRADGETVPLSDLLIPDFWRSDAGIIEAAEAGLVGIPRPAHSASLRLEPVRAAGLVKIETRTGQVIVEVDPSRPEGVTTTLEFPQSRVAWVLLPPKGMDRIHVRLESQDSPLLLTGIDIHNRVSPLRLEPDRLAASVVPGSECRLVTSETGAVIEVDPWSVCEFVVSDLSTLNNAAWSIRLGLWLAITASLSAIAWFAGSLAARIEGCDIARPIGEGRLGTWLRRRTEHWRMNDVALGVGLLVVAFHLAAALFAPIRVTPDSVSYYNIAVEFYRAKSLDAIDLYRTPGYPLLIATSLWLFGHQTQGIVLLQQLAIALLGPLGVWFLYPRTNPPFAAVGGLLLGLSPMLTLQANHIWSEAAFTLLATASILVFLNRGHRLAGCIASGALAAAATMVRPNGALFLGLMLGWLVFSWWHRWLRGAHHWRDLVHAAAIAGVFVVMVAPWLVSFRRRAGTWGLATAGDFTVWNNAYIQGRCPSDLLINAPYHLLFDYPASSAYSGRDPWNLASNAEKAGLPFPAFYYAEAFREGIRNNFSHYWRNVYLSLASNLLGLRLDDDSGFVSYLDVFTYLYTSKVQDYPPRFPGVASLEEGKPFLRMMSFRWEPPFSRARSLVLALGEFAYASWGVVSVVGIAAGITLSIVRRLRASLLISIGAAGTILAPSLVGMPMDRYVMVAEPLLYLSIVMACFAAFCLRPSATQPHGLSSPMTETL